MPNVRVASALTVAHELGSAISGSRGGSARRSSSGTSAGGRSGRGSEDARRPGLRLLVDQLHAATSAEHLGEAVDLLRRPLLGHRDEERVVEPGVVAPERVAGVDALLAGRRG